MQTGLFAEDAAVSCCSWWKVWQLDVLGFENPTSLYIGSDQNHLSFQTARWGTNLSWHKTINTNKLLQIEASLLTDIMGKVLFCKHEIGNYVCIMTLKWWNDSSHIDSDCETNLLGEMNQTPKLETCDQGVSMTASLWTVCVQDNPLLSLNALSVGLRQRSTQTNTAVERKYFHCDVPPQADTRKILSGGSPPIHTDTHITCSSTSLARVPVVMWEPLCMCAVN